MELTSSPVNTPRVLFLENAKTLQEVLPFLGVQETPELQNLKLEIITALQQNNEYYFLLFQKYQELITEQIDQKEQFEINNIIRNISSDFKILFSKTIPLEQSSEDIQKKKERRETIQNSLGRIAVMLTKIIILLEANISGGEQDIKNQMNYLLDYIYDTIVSYPELEKLYKKINDLFLEELEERGWMKKPIKS